MQSSLRFLIDALTFICFKDLGFGIWDRVGGPKSQIRNYLYRYTIRALLKS